MKINCRKKDRNRAFGLAQLLIVMAIFMRVLIPQGFMIGETSSLGAGKSVGIILCTAQGELPAIIDENGNISFTKDAPAPHNDDNSNKNSHCTFASALSDISIGASDYDFVAANWGYAYSNSRIGSEQISSNLAAPPPPKTGPPILI